ncbi:MarR family transcriptional regulator, transcriptional regulator for hemolysin [Variovorax sp. OK605]|nr:transcriptional regulator, MarR family [Variovorax sp. OK202]SFB87417.1 MarR family transcriptional regulator, transcriptional regulator for hemolysin [Variovorax sp. OK212]SFO94945.1 MarR family transcriptional regulator, transcriptional regulator for hemolysin [Variovorax sp. OK605]
MTDPETSRQTRAQALMRLGTSLSVLQRGYRAAADKAVAHVGVSQTLAYPIVMLGRMNGEVRQGVLAEALGIEGPSLVRSVDQLVEAGLVERREDPADRRAKTLHLTEAGKATCAPIEASLVLMRASLFDGVSDEDVAACLRVFGVLEERMGVRAVLTPPPPQAVPPQEREGRK